MDKKELHLVFIDFEKTSHKMPTKILWKILEKKVVRIVYIQAINIYVCEGTRTSVRMYDGDINDYSIIIGLHQG